LNGKRETRFVVKKKWGGKKNIQLTRKSQAKGKKRLGRFLSLRKKEKTLYRAPGGYPDGRETSQGKPKIGQTRNGSRNWGKARGAGHFPAQQPVKGLLNRTFRVMQAPHEEARLLDPDALGRTTMPVIDSILY